MKGVGIKKRHLVFRHISIYGNYYIINIMISPPNLYWTTNWPCTSNFCWMMTGGAGLLFLASLFHMFLCSYLLTGTPSWSSYLCYGYHTRTAIFFFFSCFTSFLPSINTYRLPIHYSQSLTTHPTESKLYLYYFSWWLLLIYYYPCRYLSTTGLY